MSRSRSGKILLTLAVNTRAGNKEHVCDIADIFCQTFFFGPDDAAQRTTKGLDQIKLICEH